MQTRSALTQPANKVIIPHWVDWLMIVIIVAVSGLSLISTLNSGIFSVSLVGNDQWSWYLVRSAGMMAYGLLAASMFWGIFLSSHLLKDWSPGPLTLLLHATTSWLAVALSLAHALLLLFENYYTYTLSDILVPFTGPYRPFAVGLGIVAFYIVLAVTVSFSMRRLIGHRTWLWLHYTSYVSFVLITVHALMAGTDATQSGVKLILFAFTAAVFVLFALRVTKKLWAENR
jgi:predicted ferric reductase